MRRKGGDDDRGGDDGGRDEEVCLGGAPAEIDACIAPSRWCSALGTEGVFGWGGGTVMW
jgi:hypothetical protein